jgi:hypothetical protein
MTPAEGGGLSGFSITPNKSKKAAKAINEM